MAGRRSGHLGQPLHHASARPIRLQFAACDASHADKGRNASQYVAEVFLRLAETGEDFPARPGAKRSQYRPWITVRDVPDPLYRSGEHCFLRPPHKIGTTPQQHSTWVGFFLLRDLLRNSPNCWRMDRRPSWGALNADAVLRTGCGFHGAYRRSKWIWFTFHRQACARIRGGRGLSYRDSGHDYVVSEGPASVRSG